VQINEYLIRVLSSKVPVDKELKLGDDVTLIIQGTITKKELEDNNDGTANDISVIKGIVAECVQEGQQITRKTNQKDY
jgi:hypothetical protein